MIVVFDKSISDEKIKRFNELRELTDSSHACSEQSVEQIKLNEYYRNKNENTMHKLH
jgi:hypothetical protein